MPQTNSINIYSLHRIVLKEMEDDFITELEPDFYRRLSGFIGNLKKQEFDGVENKLKNTLIEMATDLTLLLLQIRLKKITKLSNSDINHLLDEEKFILDSQVELEERTNMIFSATINGKSRFLESLALNHKIKKVVVRFLKEVDELVGSDLERYGPFMAEDIATIPYENAQALIANDAAIKVRWED